MRQPTTYEASFRIYVVNNCNLSSIREVPEVPVVSEKFRHAPLNPYGSNFDRRISWSMVSNAFLKSINRMAFVKPSSMLRYQLSVISIRAVRVECIGLKPVMTLVCHLPPLDWLTRSH